MATKLTGSFNLSRIPKGCITTKANGDKVIFIDVLQRKLVDAYGNTHTITVYDRNERKAVYLADLKPQEFGSKEAADQKASAENAYRKAEPKAETPAPAKEEAKPAESGDDSDLPFIS